MPVARANGVIFRGYRGRSCTHAGPRRDRRVDGVDVVGRSAEQVSLTERRAEAQRPSVLLLGLDALREDDGAGALRVRHDRGRHLADQFGRASLYERHVEFDDVGLHERQERGGRGIRAEVVECDARAHCSYVGEAAQHARRVAGEMTFGHFDHELLAEPREQPSRRRVGQRLRFGVDEDREVVGRPNVPPASRV